ncbi:MAG: GerMN domain-containing protein [Candidatus Pacebacteria bacterium]|nr:GerMN domain-containing protein [Candidatus Paceibacterota bacterium]MDD3728908.1 GerMN domain-containing protein [Candidatus Paceibacterota bacterium]MDD4201481.1 GerMN domain-containing protein [Candidatus Paceibacterota bacterium]MDD4897678.1 GerMN domain-containing protein [Candidatus Paceibacterota bacterium]MDD5445792.1 GerMN domain-containing protein [Candidatus Paceibacterota bacterium]
MRNKVLIFSLLGIVAAMAFVFFAFSYFASVPATPISSQEIAKEWVENNALTYLFDGFDLQLKDARILDCPTCLEFTYSFFSTSSGYGDRTEQFTAQVITPHDIVITVEDGIVIKAITDGVFSEIDNMMISNEEALETEMMKVLVFFGKTGEEEIPFPVERELPKTEGVAMASLLALLEGPTEEEVNEGYFTLINPGVIVQGIVIRDGVAEVDFNSRLNEVAGSATVLFIRLQIEETLKQFETIDEVIISIDKETEDILQP